MITLTPERQRFCTECDCANVNPTCLKSSGCCQHSSENQEAHPCSCMSQVEKMEEADIASAQVEIKKTSQLRKDHTISHSQLQDFHATLVDKQSNMSKRLETAVESLNWLKNQGSGTCRPNAPARSQYDTHIASLHDRLKALELVLDDLRCDGQNVG
ncbi:hypothetical protein BC829DRAFT_12395 [Chytridium lagenaria]|nr:hypothetical protein BC829DRAFT_12395 [Chytridium lagenaria]